MADPVGIERVVGDAVAAARASRPDAPAGEQLGLGLAESEAHLPLADAGEIEAIRAETGCDYAQALTEWEARGRKGRKPGARNKRSEDFERYMLQFGPHPGVALMRYLRPVELLAAELRCKRIEAAELQRKIATDLLPYFQGKKPVAIELAGKGHMTLVLGAMPGAGAADPAGVTVDAVPGGLVFGAPPEMAEICGFSEGDAEPSE